MNTLSLRRTFVLFHITLAAVIFAQSIQTLTNVGHLRSADPSGSHLLMLAGAEAVAAILFVVPKTLRLGSIVLLFIFLLAISVHGIVHEMGLLVYGAGVLFVAVHGDAFSKDLLHRQKIAA
ncbi:MAG TPA: hypothetical protein VL633_06035 [Bacteroidota bacterium]|nr:hypothetical protein [Bacteroidota bacterium]